MNITKEKLESIISDAYESGWNGCLDLKSEYVNQILEKIQESEEIPLSSTLTISASSTNQLNNNISNLNFGFDSNYYSHYYVNNDIILNNNYQFDENII